MPQRRPRRKLTFHSSLLCLNFSRRPREGGASENSPRGENPSGSKVPRATARKRIIGCRSGRIGSLEQGSRGPLLTRTVQRRPPRRRTSSQGGSLKLPKIHKTYAYARGAPLHSPGKERPLASLLQRTYPAAAASNNSLPGRCPWDLGPAWILPFGGILARSTFPRTLGEVKTYN